MGGEGRASVRLVCGEMMMMSFSVRGERGKCSLSVRGKRGKCSLSVGREGQVLRDKREQGLGFRV